MDGEDDDVYVKPIINSVLGFLMCGVNAGTVVNVKKIATQSFALPELKEAVDVLFDARKDSIEGERVNHRKKDTCVSQIVSLIWFYRRCTTVSCG